MPWTLTDSNQQTVDMDKLHQEHLSRLSVQVDTLCEKYGIQQLVIASGSIRRQFNDDLNYPFKANPYFKVWTPLCEHPNSYLVLGSGCKPKLLFFRPEDVWHHWPEAPVGGWAEGFEVVVIQSLGDVGGYIQGDRSKVAYVGESLSLQPEWGINRVNPLEVLNFLDFHRAIKSRYEQRCLIEANIIGVRGHKLAREAFYGGASELEVHMEFLRGCDCLEHEMPYETIIGFNERAAVLHYFQKRRHNSISDRYSMLIDAGALYAGYASDVTRTYSYQQDDFAELVDSFDQLQLSLIDAVKPGIGFGNLHKLMLEKISAFMVEHRLVSCSAEQCLEAKLPNQFLPHGLGHYIGAQVHDVGWQIADELGTKIEPDPESPTLRLNRKLIPGNVFTVEPGLYFIPGLLDKLRASDHGELINWERVERFIPYGGIRIEDNVILTEQGVVNMTRDAFELTRS